MLEVIHLAIQYLAMAGKSFLVPKDDDSHTNIGFDAHSKRFETWELDNNGLKLTLDLNDFSLKWNVDSEKRIALIGNTHAAIVPLLSESAKRMGFHKPYHFNLHYDLPFSWNGDYLFQRPDENVLMETIHLRTLANTSLRSFLEKEHLSSEIRVWPHHFDTGAFTILNEGSNRSMGMGMAIPDSLIDDHYFYISGYEGHVGLDTAVFGQLSNGFWYNNGFKGAILPASHTTGEKVIRFFGEAFEQYSKP